MRRLRWVRHAAAGAIALASALAPARDAAAQSIVNAGFESYSRCPTGPGLIDGWLDSWHRTSVASTDYQNRCGFSAHDPRSGEAHVGLLAYDFSANYREYATGQLTTPLVAGHEYRFEMWCILDAGRLHAVAELGAYFSAAQPTWPGTGPPAAIVPQVVNSTGILDDKVQWMLVSETFVAAGGEQFVTIGNFSDDASTTTVFFGCCGQYGAYYHVDDVKLEDVGAAATCLYRSDVTDLAPFTPPRSSVFMPETAQGIALQGASYQCPIADGDLEQDVLAATNGVPLVLYQVDVAGAVLLVGKSGTTLRFRF